MHKVFFLSITLKEEVSRFFRSYASFLVVEKTSTSAKLK